MTYAMYVPADDSRKSAAALSKAKAGSAAALGKAKAGTELHSYFVQDGRIDLLNDAINLLREAAQDTSADSGDHATCANNLGIALHDRFERTGADTDLDEAIRWLRESVAALPRDHPDLTRHLSNLATSVETRAARSGAEADVHGAIELWREASDVTTGPPHLRLAAARACATLAANTATPAAGLDGFTLAVTLLPLAAW
ncbi:MAG: tetratricopeptide repeat protein [Pseudonocardiaceae bacterium]